MKPYEVTGAIWYAGVIGIVRATIKLDDNKEYTIYKIGVGDGLDKELDAKDIAHWGDVFPSIIAEQMFRGL